MLYGNSVNQPEKEKQKPLRRKTVQDIVALKAKRYPIVALTSYYAYTAAVADQYCDILLVGDSLGMVVYGMESTLSVTLEMMINHAKAVVKSSKQALVVVDMPFSTYEESPQQAYRNAAKLIRETGCNAVKLEGGEEMSETIEFLTSRGICVMAHIGLTPQRVNKLGGYKVQGRGELAEQQLKRDLIAVQKAGAFSVVIETVVQSLANELSKLADIPTIGIGASVECDGQVLVLEDMLGYHEKVAKFVKVYSQQGKDLHRAIEQYATEVRDRTFPSQDEVYTK